MVAIKDKRRKYFWKPYKPCRVGIHWISLTEYCQMRTHVPGFLSFLRVFASFCVGQISHQQHTVLWVMYLSILLSFWFLILLCYNGTTYDFIRKWQRSKWLRWNWLCSLYVPWMSNVDATQYSVIGKKSTYRPKRPSTLLWSIAQ